MTDKAPKTASDARQPSVLVIAEAANPEWVSVPLVGWSLAQALRDVAKVHLVTQVRNRAAIERAGLEEGRDFTAIDSEALAQPLYTLASKLRMGQGTGWTINTAIAALGYPYFEHLLWQRFGGDIQAGRFDIVHRITPLSPTAASPIAPKVARAGVPFVLGPLNGGVPWPQGFDAERRREREWLSYVRGAYKLLPGRRATLRATHTILTGSRHTQSEIPARFRDKTYWIPENAIDPTRFNEVAPQHTDGPIRACFIGRLVPYKGPDIALEASVPLLRAGQMTLDIIGDGPLRTALEEQAVNAKVTQAVTFHGALPHAQVQDVAARCNLLSFPSIREFGGGVVLEAMALGVVPVVVDYGGPGELVTDSTGYKIPIGPRQQIVRNLRDQLKRIVADPAPLPVLAAAARADVQARFTWPAKAREIRAVYDSILSSG